MTYPDWLNVVKDFQSVIGAIVGFILSAVVALFISRRVAESGKLTFSLEVLGWSLINNSDPAHPRKVQTDAEATEGNIEARFSIYSSFNIRKEIRPVSVFAKGLHFLFDASVGGVKTRSIRFEPRAHVLLNLVIHVEPKQFEPLGQSMKDGTLNLAYLDDRHHQEKITIANPTDWKILTAPYIPPGYFDPKKL